MIKIHFIFDKTKKSLNFKKKILKKFKNFSSSKANIFVVAGGDGFMLSTIKKNFKFKKPFYGINCGSYGFLMNKFDRTNLAHKIQKAKNIKINPLKVNCIDKNKNKFSLIAINEASLFRQSRQTASISITVSNKVILKKLTGDGVLISTPAGSTAYNLSASGPILSLTSGKLAITPISPFRPRRWKGKIISNKSIIKIKNLNPDKRPLALVADNKEIRNIHKMNVQNEEKILINLLYDRKTNLARKIKLEQNKK